jgi:pimeloyl-ACP methyl ester carboxylesterase
LRGTLGVPRGPAPGTIEVLLAGVTYDSFYWLAQPAPGQPSYVSVQLGAGFATLALDRLGTGRSDRPPADLVGLDSEVGALHQVVTDLRHAGFHHIVLVGHSFGSSIAVDEASRYDDVDGVAASEFLHGIGPGISAFENALVPAATDPVTGRSDPPAGYLTTRAGTRGELFYDPADSDRAVRALDELTKSTMTTLEQADLPAVQENPAITEALRVPVLLSVGQHDQLLCGTTIDCSTAQSVSAWEAQFYPPQARLAVYVLAGAGHSINLHRNAAVWSRAAAAWIRGTVRQSMISRRTR